MITMARARDLIAARLVAPHGGPISITEAHEWAEINALRERLLAEYHGRRFIYWDDALHFIAYGELPPECHHCKEFKEGTGS